MPSWDMLQVIYGCNLSDIFPPAWRRLSISGTYKHFHVKAERHVFLLYCSLQLHHEVKESLQQVQFEI